MGEPIAPHERIQRPNHQEGMDVEDMRESERIKKMERTQRRLRKPLRRNEKGEFDRSTRGAKYDYTTHPEGNRALRRALKYNHNVEPAALGMSNSAILRAAERNSPHGIKNLTSEKDVWRGVSSHCTPRSAGHGEYEERRLSMPKELQDDISQPRQRLSRYPMRRPPDRSDRISYTNQQRRIDSGPPSRASSRTYEAHGRQASPHDDEHSRDSKIPMSMPYTTPASEFLYGTSVVTAALLSSRRKLYKLYIYDGENREAAQKENTIRELALKRGVVVERVKEDWLGLMYRISEKRPHNGYILEASPLPKLPVTGFQAVKKLKGAFHVVLDHQSREDEAINGTNTGITYEPNFPRYPFVLFLQNILDPGNLGAILRSAFFLGVDTVAISIRNSAPISPVANKASAGASETLPLVSVSQPGNFIDHCKSNGWKIYAAAAPTPGKRTGLGNYLSSSNLGSPLRRHPCILILGGEGEGLHWNIRRKADFDVGIDGPRIGRGDVDSLNVSVAAGVLCEAFLRKPVVGGKFLDVDNWSSSPSDGTKVQEENRVF